MHRVIQEISGLEDLSHLAKARFSSMAGLYGQGDAPPYSRQLPFGGPDGLWALEPPEVVRRVVKTRWMIFCAPGYTRTRHPSADASKHSWSTRMATPSPYIAAAQIAAMTSNPSEEFDWRILAVGGSSALCPDQSMAGFDLLWRFSPAPSAARPLGQSTRQ